MTTNGLSGVAAAVNIWLQTHETPRIEVLRAPLYGRLREMDVLAGTPPARPAKLALSVLHGQSWIS
jgi:hypothetical protein